MAAERALAQAHTAVESAERAADAARDASALQCPQPAADGVPVAADDAQGVAASDAQVCGECAAALEASQQLLDVAQQATSAAAVASDEVSALRGQVHSLAVRADSVHEQAVAALASATTSSSDAYRLASELQAARKAATEVNATAHAVHEAMQASLDSCTTAAQSTTGHGDSAALATKETVERIVQAVVADPVLKPDFALASAGASVIDECVCMNGAVDMLLAITAADMVLGYPQVDVKHILAAL